MISRTPDVHELVVNRQQSESAALRAILLFVPLINFSALWKQAAVIDGAANTELNKTAMFVLAIVFCPAYWLIVQSELNSRSGQRPSAGAAITR